MSGWQLRLIVTQWKWIDPSLALDVAEWNFCTLLMDLFNCAVSQGFCAPAMIYPVLGFRRCTGLPCCLARYAQAETWPAQGPRCRDPFKRNSGISQSLSPHCSSEKAALSLTPLSVYLSLFLSLPTSSINSILPKLFYIICCYFSAYSVSCTCSSSTTGSTMVPPAPILHPEYPQSVSGHVRPCGMKVSEKKDTTTLKSSQGSS